MAFEEPHTETKLEFVANAPEYYEFIRQLRNDDRVQGGFIERVCITPEQQLAYMAKHADCYYVCLCNARPAGYIGAIDGDIRIATHPDFQGVGVGLFMVQELVKRHPGCIARVKHGNSASLRLFKRAGFTETFVILQSPPQALAE